LAAISIGAVFIAGCGGTTPSDTTADSTIVVTTNIWADVVANVACDERVVLDILIPPGGDPHGFEPSLADRERLDNASLIVANGLALEEGLEDTIAASADHGTPVFWFSDHIKLSGADASNQGSISGNDGEDPHIWFDPMLVASALPALAADLVEHAGLDEASIGSCMERYQQALTDLDIEVEKIVAAVPEGRRKLVTNHDSLGYFARRYGFEVIGTVIPASSTLAETSPAQLERLAELIQTADVPAIFTDSQQSSDDAAALARRVGDIEVVVLDTGSLGPRGEPSDSYIGLLRTTAQLISDALK
jgi:zinc/manganese transport system substrate-binding protein